MTSIFLLGVLGMVWVKRWLRKWVETICEVGGRGGAARCGGWVSSAGRSEFGTALARQH